MRLLLSGVRASSTLGHIPSTTCLRTNFGSVEGVFLDGAKGVDRGGVLVTSSQWENIEMRFSGREMVGLLPLAQEGGKMRRSGEETMKLFNIPITGEICLGDRDFGLLEGNKD